MGVKLRLKSIAFTFWNACSLINIQIELLELIERHRLDVLLISETLFAPAKEAKLPNFNVFRANGENYRFGGGVAIFYKRR